MATLDSVNMENRNENSILYQIYDKQIFLDFYHEDLKYKIWLKKMHI